MFCRKYRKMLILYIDNRLDEVKKQKVESHLKKCNRCKDAVKDFRKIISLLRKLPEESVSQEVVERTITKLTEVKQEPHLKALFTELLQTTKSVFLIFPRQLFISVTAVAILLVCAGYYLLRWPTVQKSGVTVVPPAQVVTPLPQETIVKIKKEPQKTVVKLKIQLPEQDVKIIEETLVVSAKDMIPVVDTRSIKFRSRGSKKADTIIIQEQRQYLTDEFTKKLCQLGLSFVEFTPELVELYQRRYQRYPLIRQLKRQGLIGEGLKGELVIIDGMSLTEEQRNLVSEENLDRNKILELIVEQYMTKRKIPKVHRNKVIKKGKELMRKIFYEMSSPGDFIQKSDGKWVKK